MPPTTNHNKTNKHPTTKYTINHHTNHHTNHTINHNEQSTSEQPLSSPNSATSFKLSTTPAGRTSIMICQSPPVESIQSHGRHTCNAFSYYY